MKMNYALLSIVLLAAPGATMSGCQIGLPATRLSDAAADEPADEPSGAASRIAEVQQRLEQLADQKSPYEEAKLRAELRRLADQLAAAESNRSVARQPIDKSPAQPAPAVAGAMIDHPFKPAIRLAKSSLEQVRKIKDYSAVLIKRERIDGRLLDYQYAFVRIRHEPFSVYIRFLAPDDVAGQEAIYVAGANDGMMLAHGPNNEKKPILSVLGKFAGTMKLDPTGKFAMMGNLYPITKIGVLNLVEDLVEVGERDMRYGEAEAKTFPNARVNGRPCTAMRFHHPIEREHFRFHVAEVFIDNELNLPIRYAAYRWPAEGDDQPVLMEEYTYAHLKLNVGLTDKDFDPANEEYDFP